jgi:(2Fe-2S) ferredoxin
MDRIQSLADLVRVKEEAGKRQWETDQSCRFILRVSTASCGVAAGALDTLATLRDILIKKDLDDICIKEMGCLGLCSFEPIVQVQEKDRMVVTYGKVDRLIAQRIIIEHLEKGLVVQEYVIDLL